jgi:hypothetical protein
MRARGAILRIQFWVPIDIDKCSTHSDCFYVCAFVSDCFFISFQAALEAPDTALCPVVPTEGPEPTGAPVADIIETLSPTEVMSMDMSIVEDLIADIEMSMAMSMSYAATRSFFRLYEKSDKSEKKSKSDKSDKSEKSSKSDKKSKKRRLRVRPLYEAN